MKKLVAALCLVAVLAGAGFVGYSMNRSGSGGEQRPASGSTSADRAASQQELGSRLPSSIPANDEESTQLVALNQLIFEVAQENARRPESERMTPEEIRALVRSRVEELQAQQ